MGAAVLIDATVVRGILLPAALALLGEHAWRLGRDNRSSGRGGAGRPGNPGQGTCEAETPTCGTS